MALSPEDIVNHEFKQALRGYAVQEVDDLLDRLADQVERAERDIEDLRERLRDADARINDALATESSLKRTLITAQDAAQRTLDDAQAHADAVRGDADREAAESLEDARTRSAAILEEAQREAATIRASYRAEQESVAAHVAELVSIENRYRTKLRMLLEDELTALGALEAGGPSGGRELAALQTALGDEVDIGTDSAVSPGSTDEDPLVVFGGLTVRVRSENGHGDAAEAGIDEPDRDASA